MLPVRARHLSFVPAKTESKCGTSCGTQGRAGQGRPSNSAAISPQEVRLLRFPPATHPEALASEAAWAIPPSVGALALGVFVGGRGTLAVDPGGIDPVAKKVVGIAVTEDVVPSVFVRRGKGIVGGWPGWVVVRSVLEWAGKRGGGYWFSRSSARDGATMTVKACGAWSCVSFGTNIRDYIIFHTQAESNCFTFLRLLPHHQPTPCIAGTTLGAHTISSIQRNSARGLTEAGKDRKDGRTDRRKKIMLKRRPHPSNRNRMAPSPRPPGGPRIQHAAYCTEVSRENLRDSRESAHNLRTGFHRGMAKAERRRG